MNIKYYEEPHIYTFNGDIAGISVTQLLRKHGLAPDYSGVSSEFLKPYADKGKEIHSKLENICNLLNGTKKPKLGETPIVPYSKEEVEFYHYYMDNIDYATPEQLLGIDWKGLNICGTADVVGRLKNGELFVADHKTTSTVHVKAVTWQVNIYDYMLRHADVINDERWDWQGADKFLVFHYHDGMTVKELKKIPDSEIEKLFDVELESE